MQVQIPARAPLQRNGKNWCFCVRCRSRSQQECRSEELGKKNLSLLHAGPNPSNGANLKKWIKKTDVSVSCWSESQHWCHSKEVDKKTDVSVSRAGPNPRNSASRKRWRSWTRQWKEWPPSRLPCRSVWASSPSFWSSRLPSSKLSYAVRSASSLVFRRLRKCGRMMAPLRREQQSVVITLCDSDSGLLSQWQ